MYKLSGLILLLILSNAFAGFSNRWIGNGFYDTDRKEGVCHEVFFEFEDTDEYFALRRGGYNCSSLSAEYPSSVFEKVKGKLFFEDEEVGSYGNQDVTLSYYSGIFTLNFRLSNGELRYLESWKDGDKYLTIDAKLGPYDD